MIPLQTQEQGSINQKIPTMVGVDDREIDRSERRTRWLLQTPDLAREDCCNAGSRRGGRQLRCYRNFVGLEAAVACT
ncbi:hypothetical protein TIFTF001_005535 [Ficus carica]|uniref:Uncharacterized protein n=1 Tax=Ficus carica TaxID=3494 RepID=A0AA88A1W0_FICCA|nr:hypothetical protein TIFTF001_005535 [Ficus carica]